MKTVKFNTKNFDSGQFTTGWAYLTDSAGQPCQGDIEVLDNMVICNSVEASFSLNALLNVSSFGKVVLRTKLISQSGSFDLLDELIKGRLFHIRAELKSCNQELVKEFEEKLIELKDKGDKDHDLLSKLLFLGEELVIKIAESKLSIRILNGGTKDFLIGGQAFGIRKGSEYKDIHSKTFDLGIAPFYFFLVKNKSIKETDWALTDEIVNWLVKTGRPIKAHPLVWLHKYARPDWMLELTYPELMKFLEEHITAAINRYKDRILMWDIVNEMPAIDANGFDLSMEQLLDLTKMVSDLVKKLHPEAERIINFSEIFGAGSYAHEKPSIPPILFLKLCQERGIEYESIGLQFYMGMKKEFVCRELLNISQTVDEFTKFGKTIHFSELGWPSKHDIDPGSFFSSDSPEDGGRWHRGWDEELQAEFAEKIYTLFASKDGVKSITWWDLTDNGIHEDIGSRFIPFAGLTRRDFSPKPILKTIQVFKKNLAKQQ